VSLAAHLPELYEDAPSEKYIKKEGSTRQATCVANRTLEIVSWTYTQY
jgi:hypothetical protein